MRFSRHFRRFAYGTLLGFALFGLSGCGDKILGITRKTRGYNIPLGITGNNTGYGEDPSGMIEYLGGDTTISYRYISSRNSDAEIGGENIVVLIDNQPAHFVASSRENLEPELPVSPFKSAPRGYATFENDGDSNPKNNVAWLHFRP